MDKIKSRFNSFSGKITLIVMLGISLIAVTVSFVVLVMSRQVFTKNYGDSQEKVFEQIEKEFNDFHDHIQNVFDAIDSSWAFRLYFNETPELDNTQTFQNVYQMEQDLEKSKSADMERLPGCGMPSRNSYSASSLRMKVWKSILVSRQAGKAST